MIQDQLQTNTGIGANGIRVSILDTQQPPQCRKMLWKNVLVI